MSDDATILARATNQISLLEAWNPPEASSGDLPDLIGNRLRAWLGVGDDLQRRWRDPYTAWNEWRARVEQKGVLVISMTGVDVEEARGFSVHTAPLPVVAYNSKDSARGRLFTILHELAHLALGEDGICDLHGQQTRGNQDVEVFCNAVAAAVLMPEGPFLTHELVRYHAAQPRRWNETELAQLSRDFNASTEAVLRRLVTYHRASQADYQAYRERQAEVYQGQESGGFADYQFKVINAVGANYARLAFAAFDAGSITLSELSSHLGARLKHMDGIREKLAGRPA